MQFLLTEGGALDHFGAPVAVVRKDGRVLAANRVAKTLVGIISPGGPLASAIATAIETGSPASRTLVANPQSDGAATLEFMILPTEAADEALILGRDISLERSFREALVDSRRRYKDLVELSSDLAWETDAGGRFIFVSPGGALGYGADELVQRRPEELFDDSVQAMDESPFMARQAVSEVDVWVLRRDGANACLQTSAVPVLGPDGRWRGARGTCRDVTRDRGQDAALAMAQTRKQLLAHVIRCVRDEIDPAAMMHAAAVATTRALGAGFCRIYRLDGREGFVAAAEFGAPEVAPGLEAPVLNRVRGAPDIVTGAENRSCVLCAPTSFHRQINGALLVTRDIEHGPWDDDERALAADIAGQMAIAFEQIENQAKLEELSRTDELTGLLNRRAFHAELRERLARPAAGALFFVDLDNFKLVNDVHGHHRGDEALIAVAKLLTDFTRAGDLVGRFGGDEFALWLERADRDATFRRARELLDAAKTLTEYSGDPRRPLGLSIGVAVHAPDRARETVTGLTDRADAAMYQIKRGAKGGFVVAAAPKPDPVEASG